MTVFRLAIARLNKLVTQWWGVNEAGTQLVSACAGVCETPCGFLESGKSVSLSNTELVLTTE